MSYAKPIYCGECGELLKQKAIYSNPKFDRTTGESVGKGHYELSCHRRHEVWLSEGDEFKEEKWYTLRKGFGS